MLLALMPGCSLVFPVEALVTTPDAAPPGTCPALGETPQFPALKREVFAAQRCAEYTTSTMAGIGVGACEPTGRQRGVMEGAIGGPLQLATLAMHRTTLHSAVINPEGTRLITLESESNVNFAIETYERSDASWLHLRETPITLDSEVLLGAPSAGPDARIAYADPTGLIVELRLVDDQWVQAQTYDTPFGELQPVVNSSAIHLTPSGLAAVFTANTPDGVGARQLGYADRASLDEPFGLARGIVLPASDLFNDASLANDCSRVYLNDFTGLSYIADD